MLISDALRQRIDDEAGRYPERRGALLAALRWVQEEHGHLSPDVLVEVASLFAIRPVDVMEVATFYNMLHTRPVGRHQVYVCTNLSCALRGANGLLRRLESHLGVGAGETTADGRVTLGHEECLGACAYAPLMRVDGVYYEDLDAEEALTVLDGLE